MLKRTLTSIVIVGLIVGFLFLRTIDVRLFDIFLWGMALFGTFELQRAYGSRTTKFHKILALVYCVVIYPAYVLTVPYGRAYIIAILIGFALIAISSLVFSHKDATIEGIGLTLLSFVYPTALLILISELSHQGHQGALILAFVISPCTDAAAYIVGSLLKGPKLCPKISPNKTISGAIGGVIVGILSSVAVYLVFGNTIWSFALDCAYYAFIGLVCSLLTIFGDLVESQIKRKLQVKDMGKLLPGHGGVLDRIDGLLFSSTALYVAFCVIVKNTVFVI
ncbi:MAG: phosphatidate cytidylyltransferase [Clostridia bacterium]|nr:phosphatidate cytidylyltransferase [Clostridia bacterium]